MSAENKLLTPLRNTLDEQQTELERLRASDAELQQLRLQVSNSASGTVDEDEYQEMQQRLMALSASLEDERRKLASLERTDAELVQVREQVR